MRLQFISDTEANRLMRLSPRATSFRFISCTIEFDKKSDPPLIHEGLAKTEQVMHTVDIYENICIPIIQTFVAFLI